MDQVKLVKERGRRVRVCMFALLHVCLLVDHVSLWFRTGFFQSLLGTTACKGGAPCTALPQVLQLGKEGKPEWRQGAHARTHTITQTKYT